MEENKQKLNLFFAVISCAVPEGFVRGDPTNTFFVLFLINEGGEEPNTTNNYI